MDKHGALRREVVLGEVGAIALLSLSCWLLPKHFGYGPWKQGATGIMSSLALVAAGYRCGMLEKEEIMDRALQAAQRDLFTSELATDVYLQQWQHQQLINATVQPIHQDAKAETTQSKAIQPASAQVVQPASPQATRQVATVPSASDEPEALDLDEAIHYPSIIVFGAQGSGKTTLAKAIATNKANHGHRIQVLDPHGSDWPFPSVGGGMDYGAVEDAVVEFIGEVQQRYHEREQGQSEFQPYTAVCEEFTNWAGRLDKKTAIEFLRTALCDIRKVFMGTLFVVHANTLEGGLAGASGLAQLRDAGCYQIELFAEIDPITKRPRPTGKGRLYRPGMPPVDITIPLLVVNNAIQPVNNLNNGSEYAEYIEGKEYRGFPQPYSSPQNLHEEPIQAPFSWLEGEKSIQIMQAIATHCPKHKSIESILGFKSGATQKWQQASRDWDIVKQTMTQAET